MKHVFVVGSHSPYLTSLGVIKQKKLKYSDVVFLFARHYHCCFHDTKYKTVDVSDVYLIYFRGSTRKELVNKVKIIDRLIEEEIGDNFVLYQAAVDFPFSQILATHQYCAEVKLIQEGIIDFCSKIKIIDALYCWLVNEFVLRSDRYWKSYKWNSNKRLKNKGITETFAISEKLYKNIEVKHTIVQWPSFPITRKFEEDSAFFLFESAVEMKLVEKELYLDATNRMINKYSKSKNYVKFHPFQSKENVCKIKSIFEDQGLIYEELEDDIPMELLLSSCQGLNIYGFSTSLIFFSMQLGHNAISFVPALLASKKFQKYWNRFSSHLSCYGKGHFLFKDL